MVFGAAKPRAFQNYVEGTWGEFHSISGKVDYLLTKARLGREAATAERRLTTHLVPVREVLRPEDLNFNQLLQRDLDDHRVAVSLIPYLLSERATGPALFPPIMAVLLPFDGKSPTDFPALESPYLTARDDMTMQVQDAGESVRISKLYDGTSESLSPISYGRLEWNSEYSRLVVLDGQHRAMALLAIDRTIRDAWSNSGGDKYRFFYEKRIKDLLRSESVNLDSVEVPVMVAWFPDLFGPKKHPHKAARQVFVDVNKEARQPSESRIILLSDVDLTNILARRLLSELRNDVSASLLPLYAVEYDNPDAKKTTSGRWSAITNIHNLKSMTSRVVFGPQQYVDEVNRAITRGRDRTQDRDSFMRKQLRVDELFGPVLRDADNQPFQRNDLGELHFPATASGTLEGAFASGWGRSILVLLSDLHPYKSHCSALTALKNEWVPSDAVDQLAHDALFSGVGMFWTLRDAYEYHKEETRSAPRSNAINTKPEISKAWEILEERKVEFHKARSQIYLGTSEEVSVTKCNEAFELFSTRACQVGLALTFATIWRNALSSKGDVSLEEGAKSVAAAINSWLQSGSDSTPSRALFLHRGETKPINVLGHLDVPRAIEFRYFWLEVLSSAEALKHLSNFDPAGIRTYRDSARWHYLKTWIEIRRKALRTSDPNLSDEELKERSRRSATNEMRESLDYWFSLRTNDFDAWHQTSQTADTSLDSAPEDEESVDDDDESNE